MSWGAGLGVARLWRGCGCGRLLAWALPSSTGVALKNKKNKREREREYKLNSIKKLFLNITRRMRTTCKYSTWSGTLSSIYKTLIIKTNSRRNRQPFFKQVEGLNGRFSQKDVQVAKRLMTRDSTSPTTMEMQVRSTTRFHGARRDGPSHRQRAVRAGQGGSRVLGGSWWAPGAWREETGSSQMVTELPGSATPSGEN